MKASGIACMPPEASGAALACRGSPGNNPLTLQEGLVRRRGGRRRGAAGVGLLLAHLPVQHLLVLGLDRDRVWEINKILQGRQWEEAPQSNGPPRLCLVP